MDRMIKAMLALGLKVEGFVPKDEDSLYIDPEEALTVVLASQNALWKPFLKKAKFQMNGTTY